MAKCTYDTVLCRKIVMAIPLQVLVHMDNNNNLSIIMVVMDRKEYMEKVEGLLAQPAYRTIDADPTNKLKAKLILTLKRIKRETNMGEGMYRTLYPTSCTTPKFYGLLKIHKTGTPLRPIVSSRSSVTYGVAKVMTKVLKPPVGKLPHHIQSTSNFVSKVRKVTLLLGNASAPMMLLHCSPLYPQIQPLTS